MSPGVLQAALFGQLLVFEAAGFEHDGQEQ
jgi:hypothetical protein